MTIMEKCGCGAELTLSGVATIDAYVKHFDKWRKDHVHDFGPEPLAEPPLIHESGSSHERQLNEFGVTDRVPLGFQRLTD